MGTSRDGISITAVKVALSGLTLTQASAFDLTSAAVDTKGFHALGFIVAFNRTILSADGAILYSFTECDTSGGTYTAVPNAGSLPSRKQGTGNNTLVIAAGGFLQTVGVFSTKRYVKVNVTGQLDTNDAILTLQPFLLSDLQEFVGYDPATIPSDGLP